MLNLLLVMLGMVVLIEWLGLLMVLGVFLVGMLVLEMLYKLQVEEDIKLFWDVLLGLFFVMVGMLLDLCVVFEYWVLVLGLVMVLVLFKFVLIVLLVCVFGLGGGVVICMVLGLVQVGEFGFVLFNQIDGMKLIDLLFG